jgi:putative SOS response-associated peptidase YedK
MRWGLVPPWADDLAIGNRMINARGETVDQKPSFRKAFASRRCLIPADGYFEWQKTADGKQPYLIELADGGVFAMAGLWEENRKVAGDAAPLLTCTVITTEANQMTGKVHDRMPVILEPEQYDRWLDPGFRDAEALKEMLDPAAEDLLRMTPVSRHVNNPRNDDAECAQPLTG